MRGCSWIAALAMFLLTYSSAQAQHACSLSKFDPRYFRWFSDPELYVFARPDPTLVDKQSSSCRQHVLACLRKIRGNGATHRLVASRFKPSSREGEATTPIPTAYAKELVALLGTGGPFDVPSELRVGNDVLRTLHSLPADQGKILARILALIVNTSNRPLITFEADVPVAAILAFQTTLAERKIRCLVGTEQMPLPETSISLFDYLVCSPESFPHPYGDQAAVSYARCYAGDRPVLFRVKKAQFYPEVFWLATGAAGIRYEFGDDICTPEENKGLSYARGVVTLLRVGRFRPLSLEADSTSHMCSWEFRVLSFPARFVLPMGAAFTWRPKLPLQETNVYPFWLDVMNDVFVENAPIVRCSKEVTLSERLPVEGRPYAFGIVHMPTEDDRQTTIGPITPLEGELETYVEALAEKLGTTTSSVPQ
ncbi:MAG: hypothetical protein N2Z21_03685 [Candidatus Sumerlaeaceae bacterium]|nr:hypothetical protein [Candidatus Sumerlaeaceae bacterium]